LREIDNYSKPIQRISVLKGSFAPSDVSIEAKIAMYSPMDASMLIEEFQQLQNLAKAINNGIDRALRSDVNDKGEFVPSAFSQYLGRFVSNASTDFTSPITSKKADFAIALGETIKEDVTQFFSKDHLFGTMVASSFGSVNIQDPNLDYRTAFIQDSNLDFSALTQTCMFNRLKVAPRGTKRSTQFYLHNYPITTMFMDANKSVYGGDYFKRSRRFALAMLMKAAADADNDIGPFISYLLFRTFAGQPGYPAGNVENIVYADPVDLITYAGNKPSEDTSPTLSLNPSLSEEILYYMDTGNSALNSVASSSLVSAIHEFRDFTRSITSFLSGSTGDSRPPTAAETLVKTKDTGAVWGYYGGINDSLSYNTTTTMNAVADVINIIIGAYTQSCKGLSTTIRRRIVYECDPDDPIISTLCPICLNQQHDVVTFCQDGAGLGPFKDYLDYTTPSARYNRLLTHLPKR
jgi:hypothetical protein